MEFTGLRMTLWLKMTCIWNFRKETMTVCPWKGWLGGMTEVCNLTYVDLFLKIQLVDPTGPSIYDRSIQGFYIPSHLVFVRLGNLNRKSSSQTNFLKIFWLFESMSCISHSLKKNSGIFFCTKKTWSPIKTVGVFWINQNDLPTCKLERVLLMAWNAQGWTIGAYSGGSVLDRNTGNPGFIV